MLGDDDLTLTEISDLRPQALDLIERVQHQRHPDDGLLAATLADPRRVQTVQHRDDLYVRVLDVAAAHDQPRRVPLADGLQHLAHRLHERRQQWQL